jgi:hypothetical protein
MPVNGIRDENGKGTRTVEKRLFVVLSIAAMTFWGGTAAAQDAGVEDDPPAEETAPTAETPAPAGPQEPAATTPTTPAEDEAAVAPAEGEEEEEDGEGEKKKPFRRTFAGTSVYWNNDFTARSLDKNYDYTWNPNYTMGFGLSPVWNVSDDFKLSTDIGFQVELTNSDFSNKKNEAFFNDIPVNAGYSHTFKINEEVKFRTGLDLGLVLPTSRMSRYTTMYTALKVGTQATFVFPKVLEGLSLGWKPSFTKYFFESTTPRAAENPLDESPIPDTERAKSSTYQALAYDGYSINPTWKVSNGLNLRLGLVSTLSFAFGYTHNYIYKYAPTEFDTSDGGACTDPLGCTGPRDTGFNERGIFTQAFSYNLSYGLPAPLDMLSLSVGAVTATNQLAPNGQYRTPFFNRETVINFGINIDIDTIITAAQGGDTETETEEEE